MNRINPATPIGFLLLMLDSRVQKARRLERGASAVEWIIIAAIVVTICMAIAIILRTALTNKATDISNKIGSQ